MRNTRDLTAGSRGNVPPSGAVSNVGRRYRLRFLLPEVLLPGVLLLSVLVPVASCVETAECDATLPCDSTQVCYDFQCRSTCEAEGECGPGAVCAPCMQDDAEGTVDHCFESTLSACIPED